MSTLTKRQIRAARAIKSLAHDSLAKGYYSEWEVKRMKALKKIVA